MITPRSLARLIVVSCAAVPLVRLSHGRRWQIPPPIAGVVRDVSGAVLPGVTVEAASPALIDKVRTSVTDGQGLYRIVDLRPGVYAVTFSLPGFSTFRREGLELTTGFTATVNAELRVGALEETITVTGRGSRRRHLERPPADDAGARDAGGAPYLRPHQPACQFHPGRGGWQPGLAERGRPRRARQCLFGARGPLRRTTRPCRMVWFSVCRAAPSSSSTS